MLTKEQFEKREAEIAAAREAAIAAAREAAEKKKFIPELSGLSNIGDSVDVQFIGIKGLSDINGQYCHIMHMTSSKGNTYRLYVPCLKENSESGLEECPLCKATQLIGKDFYGADYDDSKVDYVLPLVMINLNVKWNKDKEEYVTKTVMKEGKRIELVPEINKRLNTSKRFYSSFVKFIEKEGDISNKVITITKVRHINEKDNKPSNTGTHLDDDYSFAVNEVLKPLNEADFQIPEVDSFFKVFDAVSMDRYINTGNFYEKKNASDQTQASTQEAPNVAPQNVALPEDRPVEESYASIQGTTFRNRAE